jgi:hypothetical protein
MPLPGRGENLKLGKGSMLMRLWSGATPPVGGYDFAGSQDGVNLTANITQAEKFGNSEKSGALLDRRVLRADYVLNVQMSEHTLENLALFLLAEQATEQQDANPTFEVEIEEIEIGKYYDIGKRRISSPVVEAGSGSSSPLVSGTDYEINTEFGMIRFLGGGNVNEGDSAFVSGSVPALTKKKLRLAQNSAPIAQIQFLCDDANNEGSAAKDLLNVWKASIAPDGELSFIGDEYGAFSLSISLLSDGTNHPSEPYGTLERIES